MDMMKKCAAAVWRKTCYVLTHRVFAALVMCAVTLSMALHLTTQTRVVTTGKDGESAMLVTQQETLYQASDAADVMVKPEEEPVASAEDTVTVEIKADGVTTLVNMEKGTVKDALKQADVSVGKLDTLNHKKSKKVTDGMLIEVDRVKHDEYEVVKTIDYEVEYKYTSALRPGQTQVRIQGREGERTITYRKVIVNGKVVDTEKVGEEVTKKPVNKVVLKGTKVGTPMSKAPFEVELDEGGQPVKFKRVLTGQCTAYTNDKGDSGSWTATGKHVAVGLVAVDPRVIPYGTKMWITSADGKIVYGYAVAADTGSALRSGHALVDLFMDTYEECVNFGRRNMRVYLLE